MSTFLLCMLPEFKNPGKCIIQHESMYEVCCESYSKPDPYSIIVPYGDKVEKQHSISIHVMNNIVSQDKI